MFGYYYVSAYTTGISGVISASIKVKDKEDKDKLSGKISGCLKVGPVNLEIKGSIDRTNETKKFFEDLNIETEFLGLLNEKETTEKLESRDYQTYIDTIDHIHK